MTDEGEEGCSILADRQIGRLGLQVKLDKGFEEGTYCVFVEFDALAARVGFTAAHRIAGEYCELLKEQLDRAPGYALGETEDPSHSGDRRRKRDLEATFLSFPVETDDGRCRDEAVKEQFRIAFIRAGQAWEQAQARQQTHRRHTRQENFRRKLDALLVGEPYAALDGTVRERLLAEIPALAFPTKGIGL